MGSQPWGIDYDGTNMWVANRGSANMTKLNASTGSHVATITVGDVPGGVIFDGTYIWVANAGVPPFVPGSVTKLNAFTGSLVATYTAGFRPEGIAFDGANIWVSSRFDNIVSKL